MASSVEVISLHTAGSRHHPGRVFGVDFSGAEDAGRRIWVAEGVVDGNALRIDNCSPAWERFGVGRGREEALPALRDFIAQHGDAVFGLDFPFGLPRLLVEGDSWTSFVESFSSRFPTPKDFKRACKDTSLATTGEKEVKRLTDRCSKTPMAPYNLWLYKQTYFGISDVLTPLVGAKQACVLPLQPALQGAPWVMEICPASTLKHRQLYFPYKGRRPGRRESRQHILEELESAMPLSVRETLRSRVVEDQGGDALDSIIAACAVFDALPDLDHLGKDKPEYSLEGYVYV